MIELNECNRDNLCVDCDNEKCMAHGDIGADCPKWKCDNDHDCEHFRIRVRYENEANWGMAECAKYNLVTDFRTKKKFETLSCVAEEGEEKDD